MATEVLSVPWKRVARVWCVCVLLWAAACAGVDRRPGHGQIPNPAAHRCLEDEMAWNQYARKNPGVLKDARERDQRCFRTASARC